MNQHKRKLPGKSKLRLLAAITPCHDQYGSLFYFFFIELLFASQTNLTSNHLGKTNAIQLERIASQSNFLAPLGNSSPKASAPTPLGDRSFPTNVLARWRNFSPTNNSRQRLKDLVRETNVTRLENFASMEIDDRCDSLSYKRGKDDEGATLEEFVYKHNCVSPEWEQFFYNPGVKEEIEKISRQIEEDIETKEVQPSLNNVFRAFEVLPANLKVIILGQDPTPQPGKATGLAFSLFADENPRNVPSVLNMLVELKLEGFQVDLSNGDLTPWTNQGVMLLNSALTVRLDANNAAGSHVSLWKKFAEYFLNYVDRMSQPIAFILWGEKAKAACKKMTKDPAKRYCREGSHPSSRTGGRNTFFGGNYFKCVNDFLAYTKQNQIDWSLAPSNVAGTST